ncbi:MAG: hypothetical protein RLZZ08_464 [Pseudomonadota bacterium]|jgi:zinc protease
MLRPILAAALLLSVSTPALAQQAPQGPEWPFAASDLPADPAWRFGTLPNGMRYLIRQNATPAGQAKVQFWIDSGSIAENDDEAGYAHFIEHMAFNGSTHVPEGDMVKLLEREGLAFGADTNAATSFSTTVYKLDLPRNDPKLLQTALMLMRETASELTFADPAVEREKGVVLSELRVRDTYALKNTVDQLQFAYPAARFAHRLPIGTAQSLQAATAGKLRGLWQRLYRPGNSAIIVVGDFDPALVEAAIRSHFADWQGPAAAPPVNAGPVDFDRVGQTDVFTDPALAERITISRHGPYQDEPDRLAERMENVRRQIGYGIIERRFQRLARQDNPPFRDAGFGTGDVFETGRTTSLVVEAGEGEWQRALAAAQAEYRRAMQFGFTPAEVAEQVANLRTALENSAAGAATRTNASFVSAALTLLDDHQVPTTPASALQRFTDHQPEITPASVMAALRAEALPLANPLIRFEGRKAPEGGAAALRAAWDAGEKAPLVAAEQAKVATFGYTDFGPAGRVVADKREPHLGIRTLTFANGLKLNLKPTDLAKDRIAVELNVDGGEMLDTVQAPLATAMTGVLPVGGLGRHTIDELQSILAGRSVGFAIAADAETFRMAATTTPRDLQLQLQLFSAALTDPAYRPQGEAQYHRSLRDYFARRTATPAAALSTTLGGILSDDDPRYSLQPEANYQQLTFARLRDAIGDRLAHGSLELGLVGDFQEDAAIALVAGTLGAIPAREVDFRPYAENRDRRFTTDRSPRVVRHDGAADQALLRLAWPTRDDSDFNDVLRLELLERVLRLELTDTLREELGQTYSPGVSASESDVFPGYGTFAISAEVDVAHVDAARAATLALIDGLATRPVDADILLRARQPLLESYDNALKSNDGWMALVDRAQTEPDHIERFQRAKALIAGLTAEDLRATAAQWLKPGSQVEVLVLPREHAGEKTPAKAAAAGE